jgi:uncharacterized membrane protein YhaH (DUF805 family)
LFSFEGRIGRLSYLGWSLVSMLVTAILGTALAFALFMSFARSMRGMKPDQILHQPSFWGVAGILLVVVAWPSLALAAKRLRDIGLPPLTWIGIFFAFYAMDHLLIAPFLNASMLTGTIVGVIFSWLSGLFLLLMPGRAGGDPPDLSYLAPEIDRMRSQARAEFVAPAPSTVPNRPRAAVPVQPQGFGRRR